MTLFLEMSEKNSVREAVIVNKWIFRCVNVYTDVVNETFQKKKKKTRRLLTADSFAYVC